MPIQYSQTLSNFLIWTHYVGLMKWEESRKKTFQHRQNIPFFLLTKQWFEIYNTVAACEIASRKLPAAYRIRKPGSSHLDNWISGNGLNYLSPPKGRPRVRAPWRRCYGRAIYLTPTDSISVGIGARTWGGLNNDTSAKCGSPGGGMMPVQDGNWRLLLGHMSCRERAYNPRSWLPERFGTCLWSGRWDKCR